VSRALAGRGRPDAAPEALATMTDAVAEIDEY